MLNNYINRVESFELLSDNLVPIVKNKYKGTYDSFLVLLKNKC